jgi:HK97 family phage major capsid protein
VVTADPQAAFVAEAAEIPVSDATFTEVDVTPGKVAGLSLVTRELADDGSPAAAQVVGQGLARDIARRVDEAFLGNVASPAPAGLGSLPTSAGNVQVIAAGASPTNLDAFAQAISQAAAVGAQLTAFVLHPTDALAFAKLKSGTALNTPLLQPDPAQPTRNVVFGVPMLVSPQATQG